MEKERKGIPISSMKVINIIEFYSLSIQLGIKDGIKMCLVPYKHDYERKTV